jgi:hypothetical protein
MNQISMENFLYDDPIFRDAAAMFDSAFRMHINTGFVFCRLAKRSASPGRRAQLLRLARNVLSRAHDRISRGDKPHGFFEQFTVALDRLRLEIEDLEKLTSRST